MVWVVLGIVAGLEIVNAFVLGHKLEVSFDEMPWDVVALVHDDTRPGPVVTVVRQTLIS